MSGNTIFFIALGGIIFSVLFFANIDVFVDVIFEKRSYEFRLISNIILAVILGFGMSVMFLFHEHLWAIYVQVAIVIFLLFVNIKYNWKI